MSEQTTTNTEENKQVLWANVPWGVMDKETGELQLTGNVNDRYLALVLTKQLQQSEAKTAELEKQLKGQVVDTSTSDI